MNSFQIKSMQMHAAKGHELIEKLLNQDVNYGGRQCLILGTVGSGKTTLMLWLAQILRERGEWCIWRGRDVDGYHMLPDWGKKVKILHHEKDEIHIYKVKVGSTEYGEITDYLKIEKYSCVEDLIQKLEQDKINVIYEPSFWQISEDLAIYILQKTGIRISPWQLREMKGCYFWFEFFEKLLTRKDRRWVSVFVDEADDLIPQNPNGLQWKLQEWVKNSVKDFRKSLISLFLAVHNAEDCDYRIIRKVPIRIYLQGARPLGDSLMTDKNIGLKLNLEEGKIEWKGYGYGGFKYSALKQRDYVIIVDKIWRGQPPTLEIDRRKSRSIIQEVREIAEREGIEEAMKHAEKLWRDGEITRRYFYEIRKKLMEGNSKGITPTMGLRSDKPSQMENKATSDGK
ncbi:MAG: hypothetical protein J7J61_03625 [Candidatus Hydrothermae bacterium]|nr:hypothetical protein [Candidatus Hydrothermae bacterium]